MRVVPCFLNLIDEISSVRIYFNDDLRSYDNRMEVHERIKVRNKKKSFKFLLHSLVWGFLFDFIDDPIHNMDFLFRIILLFIS